MNARNLQFTGAYFDGLSARKQTVTIHLSPRQMTLSLPSSGQTLTWSYADCRRQSASTGDKPPFHLEHRVENSKDRRLESLTVEDPDFLFNLRQISAISLAFLFEAGDRVETCPSGFGRPDDSAVSVWVVESGDPSVVRPGGDAGPGYLGRKTWPDGA